MIYDKAPRKVAIAKNAAANWVGFASQLVVAFFVTPILVHGLGDRNYGVWSLVESIIAYLTLFDLGLAASLVRYVAKFESCEDWDSLNRVFNTTLLAFAAAGAAALAIALALALSWSRPLGVAPDLASETRWLLILLGGKLAVGLPMSAFGAALDGLGRYAVRTAIRTTGLLARTALMLAILKAGGGLVGLVAVVVAVTIAEDLALCLVVCHYLPMLRLRPMLADRATLRLIGGYSAQAFLAMVAGRLSFQTDALVIGAFLAPQLITYFAVAARLVEYAKTSLRTITTVLTPAVSAMEARGDLGGIRRILLDGTRYVLYVILPIQVGFLTLGRAFLRLWMGPEYVGRSFPTLAILSLPLFLVISQSVSGRILYGVGRLGWLSRAVLCEALTNLVLSLTLVRPLGIEGVALGTALPNLLFNLALVVYIGRVLEVAPGVYIRRSFLKPLALAVPLAAGWWAASRWMAPGRWGDLVAIGAVGVISYAIAAALAEFGPRAAIRHLAAAMRRLSGGDNLVEADLEFHSNPADL